MLKTFKYKLYNTKKLKHIHKTLNIAGIIYNHCIALHQRYYRLFKKTLNKFQLQKHITKLKKQEKYKFWNEVGSQSIQNLVERIDTGYRKFFKKQGGRPGFKKVIKYKSITMKGKVGYKIKSNKLLFKGKWYKFWKSREKEGEIKTVSIKRDSIGDIYICVVCENKAQRNNSTSSKTVGIDFGLKKFLTLSDKTQIESPLFHKKSLSKIKILGKNLSKKKKTSNNRKKAKRSLAKLHINISNQRKDYFHKLSNKIAKEYSTVFIENLNIKALQMLWGRKVSDLGFSEFVGILKNKTNVVEIDRFFPSSKTCSCCGFINKEVNKDLSSLRERIFVCKSCGFSTDRDLNASINIHRVGTSTLRVGVVRPASAG